MDAGIRVGAALHGPAAAAAHEARALAILANAGVACLLGREDALVHEQPNDRVERERIELHRHDQDGIRDCGLGWPPPMHQRPNKPPLRVQPTTLWEYPSQHYGDAIQGDATLRRRDAVVRHLEPRRALHEARRSRRRPVLRLRHDARRREGHRATRARLRPSPVSRRHREGRRAQAAARARLGRPRVHGSAVRRPHPLLGRARTASASSRLTTRSTTRRCIARSARRRACSARRYARRVRLRLLREEGGLRAGRLPALREHRGVARRSSTSSASCATTRRSSSATTARRRRKGTSSCAASTTSSSRRSPTRATRGAAPKPRAEARPAKARPPKGG